MLSFAMVLKQVKEKVFLDDDFGNEIWRFSILETYAKFHIVISSQGYHNQAFNKTLQQLKQYDNFHRSDDSLWKFWTIALEKE